MKRRQGWLFFIIFLLTLSIYLLINYNYFWFVLLGLVFLVFSLWFLLSALKQKELIPEINKEKERKKEVKKVKRKKRKAIKIKVIKIK